MEGSDLKGGQLTAMILAVVRDGSLHEKAIDSVKSAARSLGLECLGVKPSRLAGAEGNQEYFLHARKAAGVESR